MLQPHRLHDEERLHEDGAERQQPCGEADEEAAVRTGRDLARDLIRAMVLACLGSDL